jgi:hypothetical protein
MRHNCVHIQKITDKPQLDGTELRKYHPRGNLIVAALLYVSHTNSKLGVWKLHLTLVHFASFLL